ncbi:hypothetical protein A3752_17850, partial [Oleiphilus sp. HI0081]
LMAGFTLVELMITIVVLGILLAMGAPSIQETIDKARLTSQTNATLGMLAYARSEGAKRPGTTITLCASNSINTGAPACDTNDWENGWFIMSDLNGDQVLDNINEDLNGDNVLDPGEDLNGNGVLDNAVDEVLRVGERLTGDNTLRTFGFPNQGFVQFDSNGIPGSSGTFVLCDERGITEAKAIIISVIGHVRSAVDEEETPDDIVNNHEGVNVICPAS